jgi:hypothetical protein
MMTAVEGSDAARTDSGAAAPVPTGDPPASSSSSASADPSSHAPSSSSTPAATPPRDLWQHARLIQPPDETALWRRALITLTVLLAAWIAVAVALGIAGVLPSGQ